MADADWMGAEYADLEYLPSSLTIDVVSKKEKNKGHTLSTSDRSVIDYKAFHK